MKEITVSQAINRIARELKNDKGYREGWKANIAMSFVDAHQKYNGSPAHEVANIAADNFIEAICR